MNGKPLCIAQFYLSAGASQEQIQRAFRFSKSDVSDRQWKTIVKDTQVDEKLKIRVADFVSNWGSGKSKFGEDLRFGLAQEEIELDAGIKLVDTPNCKAEGLGLEAEYLTMKANMARCQRNPAFTSSLRQYESELSSQNTENQKSVSNTCLIPRTLISEKNWSTLNALLKACSLGANYSQFKQNTKFSKNQYDFVKHGLNGKNCIFPRGQNPSNSPQRRDTVRNGGGLMAEQSFDQIYRITKGPNERVDLGVVAGNWILHSCFTGWGRESVEYLGEWRGGKPDIMECEAMFGEGSEWGVKGLKVKVDGFKG